MKITVVGAGAMGSLFGALLSESGISVRLYDIWAEHVKAINENGLGIELDGKTRSVNVKATTDKKTIGKADLAIIFVKSTRTGDAARVASELVSSTGFVLTLQNGMGNADIIAEVIDPGRIIAGTTSHGATMLEPGLIRHAGIGPTLIGMWSGDEKAAAQSIADVFNKAGIATETMDDIRSVVWKKLIINVGINAITALTAIKNGQILDLSSTRALVHAAVEEAMEVARTHGIKIPDDMVEHVFQVAEATGANRSSMGQDVDNKRQTEIGAINGAVVKEAQKLGLNVPVNQTLTTLLETLQAHYS
ncbi:MAG: 2-dehydropantoate 2-reductase [Deltaproteobacteria bacterium]|jgi:2-dehydropantoate 2-reductase|nr:2-dehydropantoate 2-reductase [Deltaproteobacteria bacterium]MBW2668331.1 2-dehydropantoate 2-reductase [Deltaproteobacteria bacterium]MBW2711427.1 2-dehydropantoate 2-reductase [Deltaproteobacteria bacterium]